MNIKNDQYEIRPLQYEDRLLLKRWTDFEDPIFKGYNYSDIGSTEMDYWYRTKQERFRSSYFSIISPQGDLIGFFGIKEINKFLKTAKLGIVLDSKYVSQGYGKMVMKDFLRYYFEDLNMRKLYLEVNAWNERALALYQGLGFSTYGYYYQRFENQQLDIYEEKYDQIRPYFEERFTGLYNKVYKMSLNKQEYEGGLDEN